MKPQSNGNKFNKSVFPDNTTPRCISARDAALYLWECFYPAATALTYYYRLREELAWRRDIIRIHGKNVPIPRLNAWYGDSGAAYTYSGLRLNPLAWTPLLRIIKTDAEGVAKTGFNGMLANCYRDGRDSVAWHSDDEPELGRNPLIASFSFGAPRRFVLRRRDDYAVKLEIPLSAGSLLLMAGSTQHYWQHQVPKTAKPVGERINLTFRRVLLF